MEHLDSTEHVEREPRPLLPETVTKILQAIAVSTLRDRALFPANCLFMFPNKFWFPSRSFSCGVPLMYLSLSADTPARSAILIHRKHT